MVAVSPTFPAKFNRKKSVIFSAFLYRYSNLIERFFRKNETCPRLGHTIRKRADNFLAAIKLFSTRLWIAVYGLGRSNP